MVRVSEWSPCACLLTITEQRFPVVRTVYAWTCNNLCRIRPGAHSYAMRDGASWRNVRLFLLHNQHRRLTPLFLMSTETPSTDDNKRKTGLPTAPSEPLNTLEQAFSPYTTDRTMLVQLAFYFESITVPEGHVVWRQGEPADSLYVVGTGVLRAAYRFTAHTPAIEESMVPGTLAGELSRLAALARNATVVAKRPAVLWRLSADTLRRLEVEQPELARAFTCLVLKGLHSMRLY